MYLGGHPVVVHPLDDGVGIDMKPCAACTQLVTFLSSRNPTLHVGLHLVLPSHSQSAREQSRVVDEHLVSGAQNNKVAAR